MNRIKIITVIGRRRNIQKLSQKPEMENNMVQSTIKCKYYHKIGKHFLSLLDTHIPQRNKFHKIFNRNTGKMCYSCMSNARTIINLHNLKITKPKSSTKERTCNCIDKAKCLLRQNCLINNIIYNFNQPKLQRKNLLRHS